LGDALVELRLLAVAGLSSDFEQLLLARNDVTKLGVAGAREQIGSERFEDYETLT